jgi:hypothetical protein
MPYENRKYVIFSVSELSLIDFEEVMDTSEESVRKSLDGTLTFVKYDGDMPSSVSSLTTKTQEYTYSEMMNILEGEVWEDPNFPPG